MMQVDKCIKRTFSFKRMHGGLGGSVAKSSAWDVHLHAYLLGTKVYLARAIIKAWKPFMMLVAGAFFCLSYRAKQPQVRSHGRMA